MRQHVSATTIRYIYQFGTEGTIDVMGKMKPYKSNKVRKEPKKLRAKKKVMWRNYIMETYGWTKKEFHRVISDKEL